MASTPHASLKTTTRKNNNKISTYIHDWVGVDLVSESPGSRPCEHFAFDDVQV